MPAFTYREPIKVVADVLEHEIGFGVGRLMLADQKVNIPKDSKGLYGSLEYIGPSRVIANTSTFDPATNEEVCTNTSLFTIQIDWMSFDNSAREKLPDILMAFASVYSQQMQEKYQCQIAVNPAPPVDNSNLEASGMLKRYTTTVNVTSLKIKRKVVEYFDTFQNTEEHYNA